MKIEITADVAEMAEAANEALERMGMPDMGVDEVIDLLTRQVAAAFRIPASFFALPTGLAAQIMKLVAEAEEQARRMAEMERFGASPLTNLQGAVDMERAMEALREKMEQRMLEEGSDAGPEDSV